MTAALTLNIPKIAEQFKLAYAQSYQHLIDQADLVFINVKS
ncbi:hypothetical protein ACVR0P_01675 [Streptococcus castoreus]|nr:hypothetical protein [Streptococcus castoreus]